MMIIYFQTYKYADSEWRNVSSDVNTGILLKILGFKGGLCYKQDYLMFGYIL